MNNVVIGGPGWTYYETIGGGQGREPRGPGPSGVHVGMSNTLNTPIEALELEFPLRIERYELRYGSGGAGGHAGGDGIVRETRILEPASLSLLTDRRRHGPLGAPGRRTGEPGRNLLTARRCRRRRPASSSPATSSRSRPRAAAAGGRDRVRRPAVVSRRISIAAVDQEHRASATELFFDLVFVFAFTQVATLLADDPTFTGIGRGVLVLAALWWAWAACGLAHERPRSRGRPRRGCAARRADRDVPGGATSFGRIRRRRRALQRRVLRRLRNAPGGLRPRRAR